VTPSLSLIIAVYNKPEYLRLVLAACERQSMKEFEVIIADDGSGPAIKSVINEKNYPFPVTHLWHEDEGWRKNTMLNKAIIAATTDYLVFVDGDCLPSEHFMHDHWNEREPKTALLGRRVETSERWSKALTLDAVTSGAFERYGWREWMDGFKGNALRLEDGIRMPTRLVRRMLLRNVRGMLGSNFSVAKADMEAINGFDELYDGPGCGEDSDVQYRLSIIGVKGKSMRNLAIQYHIHHPITKTSQKCWDRFEMVKRKGEARCDVGLVRI